MREILFSSISSFNEEQTHVEQSLTLQLENIVKEHEIMTQKMDTQYKHKNGDEDDEILRMKETLVLIEEMHKKLEKQVAHLSVHIDGGKNEKELILKGYDYLLFFNLFFYFLIYFYFV